jgi:hypothetical protein
MSYDKRIGYLEGIRYVRIYSICLMLTKGQY